MSLCQVPYCVITQRLLRAENVQGKISYCLCVHVLQEDQSVCPSGNSPTCVPIVWSRALPSPATLPLSLSHRAAAGILALHFLTQALSSGAHPTAPIALSRRFCFLFYTVVISVLLLAPPDSDIGLLWRDYRFTFDISNVR